MARIVFFGTPLFAQRVVEIVALEHQIVAIVTQPDRPFGRKQEPKPSAVKEFALTYQLPLFQPQRLDEDLLKELEFLKPDFFLVVAFGQIFPKSFLDFVPCINIHASILPHLRGASPLQEMILQDQKRFGITAMMMEEGLDCGDILGISMLDFKEDITLEMLACKLADMGGELAKKVLRDFALLVPLRQNHCDASVCKKIKKEDGKIAFNNAREVFVKFLAFSSWPSVFLENGLKLTRLEFLSNKGEFIQGEILEILEDGIIVGCLKGRLKILEVQPPSKQKMKVLDYLRGKRLGVGDRFC